jgi:DivIVA domain-containing protein
MRGERLLLRLGEYLIARACRRLPAGTRDERYREWAAELPAILRDPDTRLPARRAARMLGYAAGTLWGTARAPGSTRRLMERMPGIAARAIIFGLMNYFGGWVKTPEDLIYVGIGFCIGSLIFSGIRFAYRRWRGKGLGDQLTEALEARARARRKALEAGARARREAFVARAFAGPAISMAGHTAGSFPRHKLGPGYRAAEVDELIARIEATLSGHARPAQAITATDVQSAKFNVTWHGGYDEQTVDLALDHYADALAGLAPSDPWPSGAGE